MRKVITGAFVSLDGVMQAPHEQATQQEAFKFRTSRALVTPSRQFPDASSATAKHRKGNPFQASSRLRRSLPLGSLADARATLFHVRKAPRI
jgi:hypothetical protein